MNKKKPLILIGLPVYNGEKYITKAIKSVFSQSYENFILYISDNASTDRTSKICSEFKKNKKVKYYKHKKNIGAVNNFIYLKNINDKLKCDFFIYLAHDDYWSNNYLAELVKNIKKTDFGIRGDTHNVDSNESFISKIGVTSFNQGEITKIFYQNEKFCKGLYIYSLFNNDKFIKFNLKKYFSNLHGADPYLSIFFLQFGNLRVINTCIHFYRTHRDASSFLMGRSNFGIYRLEYYFLPIRQYIYLNKNLNIKIPLHTFFTKFFKSIIDIILRSIIFLLTNKKY